MVSRSLAAFSNSNFLAASRMSDSSLRDVGVQFGLGGEVGHAVGFVGEVGVVGFEDAGEAHLDAGG